MNFLMTLINEFQLIHTHEINYICPILYLDKLFVDETPLNSGWFS